MKKNVLRLLLICFFSNINAQNMISFGNDAYSGINAVALFPTQSFTNPNPWDVNLVAADVNAINNYLYISQQNVLSLAFGDKIKAANHRKGIDGENLPNILDYYNKKNANLLVGSDIYGPSFSVLTNIKSKKYVFGIFTKLRTQVSVIHFDNYLRYGNQSLAEPDEYIMHPFKTQVMNWGELGLNMATEIFTNSEKKWILGANLKYEIGLDVANIINQKDLKITSSEPSLSQDTNKKNIYVYDYDVAASYITNYNFDKKRYELKQNGKGLGLDLGISMIDKDDHEEEYNTKLSFGIVDLGSIRFGGGINHRFAEGNKVWLQNNPVFDNQKFENPEQYLRLLSNEAYGDPNKSRIEDGFVVGLPTSIHLNYSQRVKSHHFININWIQRTPVFKNALKRNNLLNINYSVQKKWLGYGISSTLSEYNDLQFGGYLRLGPLILGSENALPLFIDQKKLHAANVYLAIKLYPFWDDELKRHRRQKCDCEK